MLEKKNSNTKFDIVSQLWNDDRGSIQIVICMTKGEEIE